MIIVANAQWVSTHKLTTEKYFSTIVLSVPKSIKLFNNKIQHSYCWRFLVGET